MFKPIGIAAVIATVLTATTAFESSQAADRSREGTFTTGQGRTGSYSTQTTGNRQDGFTKQQTITGPGGNAYNRTVEGQYDRESGQFERNVTGPRGNSRSVTGTAKDGQFQGNYSTSTGKSGSFEGNRTRNEDGSVTRQNTWTNQDGQTRSREVNRSYDRDSNTVNRNVSGPRGSRSGSVRINRNR